jgi:Na+-transporting methylmalonyl-CoA/oxaloacetate decarboxylase gamma subunit
MTTATFVLTFLFILSLAVAVGKTIRCLALEAELSEEKARNQALRRALDAANTGRPMIFKSRVFPGYWN